MVSGIFGALLQIKISQLGERVIKYILIIFFYTIVPRNRRKRVDFTSAKFRRVLYEYNANKGEDNNSVFTIPSHTQSKRTHLILIDH